MADGETTTIAEQIDQANAEQTAKEIVEVAAAGSQTITDKIRLANLGRRYPLVKVLGQATYSMGLAEQHKDRLREAGFSDEDRAAMASKREALSTVMATQQLARTNAHAATRTEGTASSRARNHQKKLMKLLPIVLRKHKITDVTIADLQPDSPVGRSTNKLLKHLEKSRKVLAKLEEQFKPYFGGRSPLEVHDEVTRGLANSDLSQESQRRELPGHGFELLAAKGELVQLIEDMNRIGQIAFEEDELVRGQFNSDILKRASRKASAGDNPDASEAPEDPDAEDLEAEALDAEASEAEEESSEAEENINPDEPDPAELAVK